MKENLDNLPIKVPDSKRPSLFIFFIPLFILIIAISYLFYDFKKNMDALRLETQKQQRSLAQTTEKSIQALHENTTSRFQNIDQALAKIELEQTKNPSDWILLKARFYLELASLNNTWTNDTTTTVALLESADMLLARLSNPNLTSIRQAIADEKSAATAVAVVDITGILSTLNSLQQALTTLSPVHEAYFKSVTTAEKNNNSLTWRDHAKQTIQKLRALIVIRHHDELASTYMTPTYLALQTEAIRLNLEESQWAVLQHNNAIFQLTITKAMSTIERVFDSENPKTIALMKELNQLKKINLDQPKPSLAPALEQLNELIEKEAMKESST